MRIDFCTFPVLVFFMVAVLLVSGCVTDVGTGTPYDKNVSVSSETGESAQQDVQQVKPVSIDVTSAPTKGMVGDELSFAWKIDGTENALSHTGLHYGYESSPGKFGKNMYPEESNYTISASYFDAVSVPLPAIFEVKIIPNKTGTIYFRAHVVADYMHYWTDEGNVDVTNRTPEEGKPVVQPTKPPLKIFNVTARQWDFLPSTINVKKGDLVRLIITSVDVAHGFRLDEYNINERLYPSKEVTVEFVADKAGIFVFRCSVSCGSGHGSMRGTLTVE